MKTTLTEAESAKLIEFGIDPKFASAGKIVGGPMFLGMQFIPVFRLDDILPILPKEIWVVGFCCNLVFEWDCDEWYACYQGTGRLMGDSHAPELIDALYQLLIWAIEHKYVKTNKDK